MLHRNFCLCSKQFQKSLIAQKSTRSFTTKKWNQEKKINIFLSKKANKHKWKFYWQKKYSKKFGEDQFFAKNP
jgi:S-adenosylmethionine:tRNA-ribosyltransferase-isomerase (queuine synthetase)